MDGTEPVLDQIPSVGEHTARILAELGYDEDSVTDLRQSSAI
jgi:crotonobetainyl-CoA:carnitine CoA-transferase CaiB-like acyl-CoA transferase